MEKRVDIVNRTNKDTTSTLAKGNKARVAVPANSHVKIAATRDAVAGMEREGDDLIMRFTDGSTLRLDGYFDCPTGESNALTLSDPGMGGEFLVDFNELSCLAPGQVASQTLSYSLSAVDGAVGAAPAAAVASGGGISGGLLAGLGVALLGGGAAVAAGGGGGGDRSTTPPPPTADNTPPSVPVVVATTSTSISGTADPGSMVQVDVNGDGSADVTVPVSAAGQWTVSLDAPIPEGTAVVVRGMDPAGNSSEPTRVVVDMTAPDAPTIDPTDGTAIGGLAEPGSSVLIDLNGDGTNDATVTAGPDGRWSYTPAAPLTDGTTVTVVARDAAGNDSAPTTRTIDLAAPAAPGLTAATDDVGSIQGAIPQGASTNDATPTFRGTAEAGAAIAVFDGGTQIGTTTVDANGGWTFTPATPLAEGTHSLTFVATDAAGNSSAASAPFGFTVDVTAPSAPQLAPTNGTTVSGTSEPGATILLDTNGDGTADATTVAGASGAWSVTLGAPLSNGAGVRATAVDAAGNTSATATATVTTGPGPDPDPNPQPNPDVTPPAAPVVGTVTDDVAPVAGAITGGATTNDTTPSFRGTAEAGAAIAVFDGGARIGTTTADASGAWTFTPATPLTQGPHSLTFVATDAAGNSSAASAPFGFTVDVTAPTAPQLAPTTGTIVSGTSEPGATILLDTNGDGTADATTVAGVGGAWSVTLGAPLSNGTVVRVTAVDAAGNTSPAATTTVTTGSGPGPNPNPDPAPAAPVIGAATDDVTPVTGALTSGATTNDATPTFTGTTQVGASVAVFDGGTRIGAALVDANGGWTFTPSTPLGQGTHNLTFVATSAQGTVGTASAPFVINVDTVAPALTVATSNGSVVQGTAEPGASVAIDFGDQTPDVTVFADQIGNWSHTPDRTISDGATVTVIATDAAGNTSTTETVVVDASIPVAPAINSVIDNVPAGSTSVANGGFSNDPTLALAGTGEALATITIYDGTTRIGTTTADATGNWSLTTAALAAGAHSFTATSTDATGNVGGPSPIFAVTTDYTAPLAPAVTASDGTTLSGTAEAGTTVQVDTTGDGTPDTTAPVGSNGEWRVTFNPALADGTAVSVVAVDAAGNVSPAGTVTVSAGVDSTPPAVPTLDGAEDDLGPQTGPIADGSSTNDTTPTLSGTAEPGVLVTIYDGETAIASFDSGAGNWTYTLQTPLAPGAHSLTATTTDAQGNESAASAALAFTVDTVAPPAPSIAGSNGDTVSGVAEPGSTVRLDIGGGPSGIPVSTDPVTGAWTYSPPARLADGVTVTAVAVDAAGNVSNNSATVVVDAAGPTQPAIGTVSDNFGSVTGPLANGAATDDNRPTLGGTTEAGALVTIYDGTQVIGTTTANGSGAWTFTPTTPLPDGERTLSVTATDTLGNASSASAAFVIFVDTVAPVTPAITRIADNVGSVQDDLVAGSVTDDLQPTLSGTAEGNARVTVFRNGVEVGSTDADADGDWTLTPQSPLPQGAASFTVVAADAAGNVSGQSAAVQITIDASTPPAPAIASANDDVGSVRDLLLSGATTDDPRPVLSGTAQPGATVTIFQNGAVATTVPTDATGGWSFTPAADLTEGIYTFAATATSPAGVVGPQSAGFVLTIDTSAPEAPSILRATDDFGTVFGPISSGGVTDDIIPVLSGTAAANALVTVLEAGKAIGSTAADGSGNWTFTPNVPLFEGLHVFTATATDAAGNTGSASTDFTLTVDTIAPETPVIAASTGAQLTGTAEVGATVNLDLDGNGSIDTTTVATDGTWTYTPPTQLADGATVIVSATDAAGNTSGTDSIIIDRTAPAAPIVLGVLDDAGPQTGLVGNNGTTDDVRPVLIGTAEPGALVTVSLDGAIVDTVTAGADGSWQLALADDLPPGPHQITATAADTLGNTSPASPAVSFTVDIAAPEAPVITAVSDDVTPTVGTIAQGAITNDGTPTISGTSAANATIQVFDNGAFLGTAVASASGTWSFTPATPLGQGTHAFTAAATNGAGNTGAASVAYSVVVDTIAPATPAAPTVNDDVAAITGRVAPGGVTNDNTPTLSGTTDPNATVSIFDNGALLTTTTANANGEWSVSPTLAEGAHSVTVSVRDTAGNDSATSPAFAFTIDTTAPADPTVNPTNGLGALTGTSDPGTTVQIDIGGTLVTVPAQADGTWSYTFTSQPADNTVISVTAVDAAGNLSGSASVEVDTVPPSSPTLTSVTDDQAPVTGTIADDEATNDPLPVFVGRAEANATVRILDGTTQIGTALANANGDWTFTPTTPLSQGPHSITLIAVDVSGNQSAPSTAFDFDVITAAPLAPAITAVTDNIAPRTGAVANGGSTNDEAPVISGTAQEGETVTLFIDGVEQSQTVVAGAGGAFTFNPTLTEGAHTLTVIATNAAGLTSGPSAGYSVTVDTEVLAPTLNASDGNTVSGTGEPGSTVQIFLQGENTPIATAVVNSFGDWSTTAIPPLADDTGITARQIDLAGNVSPQSVVIFTDDGIDTTPPPAPTITEINDDVGDASLITQGSATNDARPAITGTTEVGSTVTVYDGTQVLGTAVVDGAGNWTFTPGAPLSEGPHSISATAALGNLQSLNSAPIGFTVDVTAPDAPTIAPSNGRTLTGTAEANAFVDIDTNGDGTFETTVQADGSGGWSLTRATPLPNGTVVRAVARDAAGNVSTADSQAVDSAPPARPTITGAGDNVGPVQGNVANGGATDDATPTLSGAAEANATVTIREGATVIGTTTATGGGTWTFTLPTPLAQGAHSFTVTATDALGNASVASSAYTVNVITTPPPAPVITSASDDVGNLATAVPNGGGTNDARPLFTGTTTPGSSVAIFEGTTPLGDATVDAQGNWSFTPATPLGDGVHTLTAVATNATGVPSAPSGGYTVNVDTTPPTVPAVTFVTDDVGATQGAIAANTLTDDARPTLTGTAEADATISIFDGATLIGTTTASGTGAWSFTPAAPLPDGLRSLTVTATDALGNESGASTAFAFTVDATSPAAPAITGVQDAVGVTRGNVVNGGVTDDAAPLLSGTAEQNAVVSIFNNGALIGTAVANGSGAWSFSPPSQLAQGTNSFTATQRDAAGNVSPVSSAYSVTVDTVAPAAPTITTVTDDAAPRTGVLANGAATNDTTPALAGTAEANAAIAVFANGVQIGTTSADGSGSWSFTPATPLGDGNTIFTARATDLAGNQGPASSSFAVRIDNSAPAAPVISGATDDVSPVVGNVANGGVTNDTIPLLRGTAEASSTLTLFANGVAIGTTTVNVMGDWTFSPASPLAEGTYTFTAAATDAAGNVGATSAVFSLTVDTTPPATPTITSIVDDVAPTTGVVASGGISNDASPQLTGTGPASTTLQIFDGAVLIGSTTTNAQGGWTYTPTGSIADGNHSFTAVAVDAAGNASAASNAYALTVDTAGPTQTIAINSLSTDTGAQGDFSTQDTTPVVGGTLSAALGTGERLEVRIDGGNWVSATTNGTTWFYGAGTLSAGAHSVAARVVDAAGNVGNGATRGLTIEAVPPQAPIVQANGSSLLGLVGVEALALIDLSTQSLSAVDPNNNLQTVQVRYAPLLGLLPAYTLTGSAALANELGLQLSINNNAGILGLVAPSSTVTITARSGGAIDNLAINELLNTIHFEQTVPLLNLDLLNSISISATDTTNRSASSVTGNLLNLSLLSPTGSPNLFEGTSTANTLTGTAGNDRIYGYGGNDTLLGGAGNDLLRGGSGADRLYGEAGNDTLVFDALDLVIDGGTGVDTLFVESGTGSVLNLGAVTNIVGIDVIDLGTGDPGRQITLTAAGVARATDANSLRVDGDTGDSVILTGATLQGQVLINGEAYNQYLLGTSTIFIDHAVFASI